ncbi:hypothetical protein ACFFX0_33040, partial [Citricoccus parietis]
MPTPCAPLGSEGADPVHQPDPSVAAQRAGRSSRAPRATAQGEDGESIARLRPATNLTDPHVACKLALRSLARRHASLDEEVSQLHRGLSELTQEAAPQLRDRPGVGCWWSRLSCWSPLVIT